jgi:hypothetical protein
MSSGDNDESIPELFMRSAFVVKFPAPARRVENCEDGSGKYGFQYGP